MRSLGREPPHVAVPFGFLGTAAKHGYATLTPAANTKICLFLIQAPQSSLPDTDSLKHQSYSEWRMTSAAVTGRELASSAAQQASTIHLGAGFKDTIKLYGHTTRVRHTKLHLTNIKSYNKTRHMPRTASTAGTGSTSSPCQSCPADRSRRESQHQPRGTCHPYCNRQSPLADLQLHAGCPSS